MDNNEKDIRMTNGGLNPETQDIPYEEKIEVPIVETENEYDDFMSEPLGFEELEKEYEAEMSALVKNNVKKSKRQQRTLIFTVIIFIILIMALGIFCIVKDVSDGRNISINSNGNSVVLYQSDKPSTADVKYVDENGKYSTEGVAAIVRPSVVEIYTYNNAARTDLECTGSGIIISEDGYIVTNAHVLEADGYHSIKTHEDKVYKAEIVGRDSKTDIAVIKVNASNLQPATLGNSDEVVVGEEVMAIGNPAGLSGTVTNGIVSAVNRKIKGQTTAFEMDCIQTNADISPGNSGGALVNMYAQVIGITSSKYASTTLEGLGFAISINEARPIIEELINNGFISGRFKIGITFIGLDEEESRLAVEEELGYSIPDDFNGIYISAISQDCDIANTELKTGDFILRVEGKPISNYGELYAVIKKFSAGDTVQADCAEINEDGDVKEYSIEFKLMEDTSGDY